MVPTLADASPQIATAFEAAFAPGSTAQRPTAARWVSLLADMEKALKVCGRSPLHHHAPNATECPWCRIESRQGIVLFLPHAPGGQIATPSDPGAPAFDFGTAWRMIQAVPPPSSATPEPRLPGLTLVATDRALAARRDRRARRLLGLFLIRRQKIKGIGQGRVATLAYYGLATALDVTRQRIENVPGFAPETAQALVGWRLQLEARFVDNERPNAADTARIAAVRAEMVELATDLRRPLLAGPAELARVRADVDARRNMSTHSLWRFTSMARSSPSTWPSDAVGRSS